MSHANFVHLRLHSAYSLAEGAIRINDLITTCVDMNMPAVGVTDSNNMFGALEFSLTARQNGIQPIIGVQFGLKRQDQAVKKDGMQPPPDELVLLAKDEAGYLNLMDLLSLSYMDGDAGNIAQISLGQLTNRCDGLIALTCGVKGLVGRLLCEGQVKDANEAIILLNKIFKDNLYIEIQRHGLVIEDDIENALIDMAYEYDIPLVATNDCFFPNKEMFEAHDVLLCIAAGAYVSQTDRRQLTAEHYFKSPEEMYELFADLPEAIENTINIAKRCHYMVDQRAPLLPQYTKLEDRSSEEALADLAKKGLRDRLNNQIFNADMDDEKRDEIAKKYWERLDFELGIINQMGFPGYFLIVADFIQWAYDQKIPVGPGRGSGAGSVVAWALTITGLDPLRYSLLFERFLNPERVSMPDFDIDFCQERREEVINYVQREYGRDRVAQIITFGKLQARAVLRDVGRVLQMPYGQVDRICKLIPNNPAKPTSLPEALISEKLLRHERDNDVAVKKLLDLAMQLEGLYRHASTHAAGVVISDRPLHELVALYRDPKSDMPVTQFNMKYVEQAGLVKFDFLGLKTLTVIDKALNLITNRDGMAEKIDISTIPLDDKGSYEMLCLGDSTGVFQLESSGMRDVFKKLKPDRLEDLIAIVALYRPGPMENIPTYIKRKHGEEAATYLHPALEPVLIETFGIPIYQEQVMQMAQVLAGYSLGNADLLRRAMGKKNQAEMAAQRKNFCDGALLHNNVDEKLANRIFDEINAFAGYGFNKSHAAAYALIAYQTAWLKSNYQVEFLAASMTLDIHNTDKLDIFKKEIDRQNIKLLPPCVNNSEVVFSVEMEKDGTRSIRYALAAIKGLGEGAMEGLVNQRKDNGKFNDIFDFVERLDGKYINKRIMENLTKSGGFDCFNLERGQIFNNIEKLSKYGAAIQESKNSSNLNLFGDEIIEESRPKLSMLSGWNAQVKLENEFSALGFYLSDHPLSTFAATCEKLDVKNWSDVEAGNVRISKPVHLAGIVGTKRVITTARGKKMAFINMSDASGAYEVTMFEEVLDISWDLLEGNGPVLLKVDIKKHGEDDGFRVTVQSASSLEDVAANSAKGIKIIINNDSSLKILKEIFDQHAKSGLGRVEFLLNLGDKNIIMRDSRKFNITGEFRKAIKSIGGVINIQDL